MIQKSNQSKSGLSKFKRIRINNKYKRIKFTNDRLQGFKTDFFE